MQDFVIRVWFLFVFNVPCIESESAYFTKLVPSEITNATSKIASNASLSLVECALKCLRLNKSKYFGVNHEHCILLDEIGVDLDGYRFYQAIHLSYDKLHENVLPSTANPTKQTEATQNLLEATPEPLENPPEPLEATPELAEAPPEPLEATPEPLEDPPEPLEATPEIDEDLQEMLDRFCEEKHIGDMVARFDSDIHNTVTFQWRCYGKDALTTDLYIYGRTNDNYISYNAEMTSLIHDKAVEYSLADENESCTTKCNSLNLVCAQNMDTINSVYFFTTNGIHCAPSDLRDKAGGGLAYWRNPDEPNCDSINNCYGYINVENYDCDAVSSNRRRLCRCSVV